MKNNEEITENVCLMLGYRRFNEHFNYLIPPSPAHGSLYRLEKQYTIFEGGEPKEGTDKWTAYKPHNGTVIRRFESIGELNHFHKGMCGEYLYEE